MDQREEFVMKGLCEAKPFRELCRDYDISAKTGYKWMERFRQGGLAGLHDRSRRPRRSPGGLPEDVVCRIVALRHAHRTWGATKLMEVYSRKYGREQLPCESSFKRVLEKAGLVEKRVRRRPAESSGRIQTRREAKAANEVWTVDFKGWWHTTDRRRCEPLTVRDAHSRFILCADPVEKGDTETVRGRFEKVFESYGLPETMRSDNGPPFASTPGLLGLSALSVWWLALGISLDRIDPARPDQNGAHERMHRDISLEVEGVVRGDLAANRAALAAWRETYNVERPHQALGYLRPADVYTPSPRRYEGTPERMTYPEGFAERTVKRCGTIKLRRSEVFITSALRGWNVGLREEGELVGVWFGRLRLGAIDPRTDAFLAAREAVEMPP